MAGDVGTNPTEIVLVDKVMPAEIREEKTENIVSFEIPEFKIDLEFRGLIPPHDPGAKEELKNSILKDGCRDKLVICTLDGEKTLLDGHYRYDICIENGIPFETTEISVSDRTEAKIWIIKNQRGRRNLNESQRAMLAVALEELYAEEAKNRQGTRTDLGKKLDKSEAGRSAQKAADDMGVSHQTVVYAKKVSTKGIPELAGLVESGNVAVSAAAKATSLDADLQQKVVERVEATIKDGKHANIGAIIHEISPKNPENEAEERFKKSKKNLTACLKLFDGIGATQSQDKLAEIKELLEKLTAKLNEIGAKTPDPSSHNSPTESNDPHKDVDEDTNEANSDSSDPSDNEVDAESVDDDLESIEGNLSDSMEDSTELTEDWESYGDAIENENMNNGGW